MYYVPSYFISFFFQSTPPEYNLRNIKTRIALFSGTADWLTVPVDVNHTANELKDIVDHTVIDGWEHLDFIWALNAPTKCYNYILNLFKQMT